jgi:membrane protein involved in colicin uptake
VGNFHSGGTAIAYKTNLIKDAESYLVRVKIEEAKQEAEVKAAAELKAKQDAELIAKVLAARQANSDAAQRAAAEIKAKEEATAKAAADKAALTKRATITCVKGKLTKKVTAMKPKCPPGYKKK